MSNQISILIIFLVLSAVFAASETALVSLSKVKVRHLLDKRRPGSKTLARLKEHPEKLLVTILIGNNIVNIGASAITTVIMTGIFESAGVGIATGVMTFFILVFGEIIPKSLATRNAEIIGLFMARPLEGLQIVLTPAVWIFSFIAKTSTRMFGGDREVPSVTEEELRLMARLGAEEGSIQKEERDMLESVFRFNDITAEDVMTPRMDIVALDEDMKLSEALKTIAQTPYSRIPLYHKHFDSITGMLYLRDAIKYLAGEGSPDIAIKDLARKPSFVPGSKNINELFRELQKENVHIAVVLDRRGGTEGIVTLEDLIEELVGEIVDESEVTKNVIRRIDRNTILVDGATEVKAVRKFFNLILPGKDTDMVSEIILKTLGRIPQIGEEAKTEHARLVVQDADEKRIKRVKIIKEGIF